MPAPDTYAITERSISATPPPPAVLFTANILISNILTSATQPPTVTISYNSFLDQVNADNVTSITSTGEAITGVTKKPVKDSSGTSSTKFQTQRPAFANDDLMKVLQEHNVVINAKDPNASTPLWETLLFSFGPTILLVLGFLYLSRRAAAAGAGGILGSFGQSRARLYDAEKPSVTFADVAGIDEVKADLQEVVDFLREPQKYQRLGGTVPKGVLLIGAPGTGKTLRARAVAVQSPARRGSAEILKIHSRHVPLAPDVDLDQIAAQTPGLVGADLRNLVNEAALGAARKGEAAVTMADFAEAIERTLLGTERKILLSVQDRERIAYHESGHALLGLLVPGADPVKKVPIIPRGQALGVTLQSPIDDRFNYGEDYLRARLVGALGGRAAEKIVYGVVTTGAENDLMQVTRIAQQMVVRWGMSPKVGPLNYGDNDGAAFQQRQYSEATAQLIDEEVRRISEECLADAEKLLQSHRAQLDALARALLKSDSLDEAEIVEVTGVKPQPGPSGTLAAQEAVKAART